MQFTLRFIMNMQNQQIPRPNFISFYCVNSFSCKHVYASIIYNVIIFIGNNINNHQSRLRFAYFKRKVKNLNPRLKCKNIILITILIHILQIDVINRELRMLSTSKYLFSLPFPHSPQKKHYLQNAMYSFSYRLRKKIV